MQDKMDCFWLGYLFTICEKDSCGIGYQSATRVLDSCQIGYLFTIWDKHSFRIGYQSTLIYPG